MGVRRARVIYFDDTTPGDPLQETWGVKHKHFGKLGKQAHGNRNAPLAFPSLQDIPADQFSSMRNDLSDEQILKNLEDLPDVKSGGLSQNDYLREWLPRRSEYVNTLLQMEAPENLGNCTLCGTAPAVWRCRNCFGSRLLCSSCCADVHQRLPYHRVDRWNGKFFQMGALWELGVKLFLGHGGLRCPTTKDNYMDEHHTQNTPMDSEDEWEDVLDDMDDEPAEGQDPILQSTASDVHPKQLPKPPHHDNENNAFITVVDVTGIHHLPAVPCLCNGLDESQDLHFLRLGLFCASFKRIRTAFTLDVLKDFRLSNLECKTTGYQYYQKLRRLTCPAFPKVVTNRYRELRRVSRQYRNVKLHKIHGRGYSSSAFSPTVNVVSTAADTRIPTGIEESILFADTTHTTPASAVPNAASAMPNEPHASVAALST